MRNVKALFHVNFPTNNWDKMVDFYVNVCGFDQAFVISVADMSKMFGKPYTKDDENTPKISYIRVSPNSYIELNNLTPEGVKVKPSKTSAFHHIAFLTDDIKRTAERFREKGHPLFNNPIEKKPVTEFHKGEDGCLIAWAEDPDGHFIEIMQQSGNSLQEKFERENPIED